MRSRIVVSLAAAVCLAASNAFAGRIFGDIKLDGKPAPAGIAVKIAVAPTAGAATTPVVVDSAVTDKFGSYKLAVKQEGKCVLTLVYEKQAVTLEVFSYKSATRYDLILEKKGGKATLRRK